jgi:S-phase kinase-associated protein 1
MTDTAEDAQAGGKSTGQSARKVRLRSAEGDSYELPYEAAVLSILVKNTVEVEDDESDDDGYDGDGGGNGENSAMYEMDIPKVSSNCLAHVVQYLRHYVEVEAMEPIPEPLNGNDIHTIFASQPWYRDYIANMDRSMVFKVVQAANFMEIQSLLDIATLRVATEIVGKTAEEIRVILNLPRMTEKEEEEARKQHPWIFEGEQ